MRPIRPLVALALLAGAGTASASSEDAWAQFTETVEKKCLAAAGELIDSPQAVVDPHGSERFGLAIVTGKAKSTDATVSHVCVMDKESQAAELGSELSAEQVRVTPAR